jgi:two-component system phosphate regulon sensor histidine kinase PhoR
VAPTTPSPGSLTDALPLAAVVIAPDLGIAEANASARALFGDIALGRHFGLAFRQPSLVAAIEKALATRQTRTARFSRLGDTGADQILHASCAWIASGLLVCFEDLTAQESAGASRRDFVANVSHELRTPLTAILGFVETLQGPARGDTAATERFLDLMATEARRMERLVGDLLSLSKVEAEERHRPTARVDVARLCTEVARDLGPLAERQGGTVAVEGPEDETQVEADRDQLRQVLVNLIENGLKYSGPQPVVALSLTHVARDPQLRTPAVRIEVRDTGPGIDPVHLPRLTERFYRVDSHRSRQMGGTGLGLAIVKHILTRHRGRLEISSTPGKGSVFSVILPLPA